MTATPQNIPAELRDRDQWVLHRSKQPKQVNGSPAKSNDPATWNTFAAVSERLERGGFDGIGIVFAEDDGLCGIDFDVVRNPETGEILPWAAEEIAKLDSYAEVSPSGCGVKVWIKARLPFSKGKNRKLDDVERFGNTKPGVEAYDKLRYFVTTGEKLEDAPATVEHRQANVDAFCKKYFPDSKPGTTNCQPCGDQHEDEQKVVERARRYIATIDGAVAGNRGHNATFHVACVLVIEFGLSNSDALGLLEEWNQKCDPPWADHDLKHKIEDAAKQPGPRNQLRFSGDDRRTGNHRNNGSSSGRQKSGNPTPASAGGLCIDFLQHRNDIANGRRLARKFGDVVRYCKSAKSWYVWNGAIWKLDDTDEVFYMAKTVSDDLWGEARKSENEKALGFAAQSAGERSVRAMISLAASEPGIPLLADDLDSDPWLLSCPNGTIDLHTGELRPHRQADLITMLCPTEFHPDAPTYQWDRFLESLFDNDDVIRFLKRWFGYCLTGITSEQILAIFHGSGSNGKSTLLNAIRDTMGRQFCMQAVSDFLMVKKQERHSTEKADLFRVRLALCAETGSGRYLDENIVKEQTGEEAVRARRMRENFFEFMPSHKLVISTNHRPRVRDNDHAIWRRLSLVPFSRTFWNPDKPNESGPPELKIDKQLGKKLAENREGILAWMVEGCLEWLRGGLKVPKAVTDATDEYRSQEDVIGQFIEDRCIVAENCEVKFKTFYDALEVWCNDGGENLPSRKKVGTVLIERKFKRKLNRGKSYGGIGLKEITSTDEYR